MSDVTDGRTHYVGDDCPGGHADVGPPSCHIPHICPDTDERVAFAAREYVIRKAKEPERSDGMRSAYRRLADAVEAQFEDHGEFLADHQAAVASGDAFGAQVDPHDQPSEP